MNTSENPISLLELLEESKVVIPILQRDYAQGREEKEYILKQFLKDIKTTLQGGKILELDFIYGNKEGETFYPFDGQQRITTLWLLYLYLLWQKKDKDEEKIDILKKFSYQTRISAEEFCRVIPEKIFSLKIDETLPKVSDLIKKQKWFFSEWQEDPTIKAMLRALDTIQSEFEGSHTGLFLGNFGNIKFLKLEPEKNDKSSLSDDLYIKMNARGKPLTNFENFKADIFKFLESRTTIDNNKDIKKYIITLASLIDNDWTDIFWQNRHKNEAFIDEIYLEFFNRCAINEFLSDGKNSEEVLSDENKENPEEVLKKLGYESNGEFVPYEDFKIYENYIKLENIKKILTKENIGRINNILVNKPDWRKINFIPIYKDEEKQENSSRPQVESITQAQRVIFYALCQYFINIKQEEIKEDKLEDKLEDWFYFASNMVGSGIENLDAMISAIKRIEELSAHCNDIIAYLSTLDDKGSHVGFNEAQLKEEIQKAKKIKEIPDIKEKIRDAENLKFSRGTIRFLYKDEKGDIDWTNFDNKLKRLKELFGDEKETDDDELIKGRIEILKILLSYCENFENLQSFSYKEKYLFEPKYNVFKKYFFINDVMSKSVHNLLMKNGVAEEIKLKGDNGEDIPPDNIRYKILYWLVKTDLLSTIAKKWGLKGYGGDPKVYLNKYYGYYALYVKKTRTNVIEFKDEGRDKELEEAENNEIIEIKNDVIICTDQDDPKHKYKFYNGWGRTFEFEGILYTWNNEEYDTLNDFIDAKKDEKPAS